MSKRLPRGSVSPCVVTFNANHDTSEPVGLRWDPLDATAASLAAASAAAPSGATLDATVTTSARLG